MGMAPATSYKLFTDDKKTQAFANGTALSLEATYATESKERIKTLICETGTDNEVEDEDSWLGAGGDLDHLLINVKEDNTTGAERTLDVVILDSDWDAELFRIPVTQKAK